MTEGDGRRPERDWPTYRLYGLALRSDFRFRNRLALGDGPPDVTFRCFVPPRGSEPPPPGERLWPPVSAPVPEPAVSLHHVDGNLVLRFGDISIFTLLPGRIECAVLRPADAYLVEIQFLGMVLALWLEQQGIPALHASAVGLGDRAVAFLGAKGAGKTSMAATFLQGGHALVSDDLLALQTAATEVRCHSGYPHMRMWPEEARHFVPGARGLEIVHPAFTKLRVPVGPGGFGSFSYRPRPLAGLYILERRADDGDVRIVSVTQGQATIELIRYSFLPGLVQAMGLAHRRLVLLAEIASQVPLWRLGYPAGLDRLARARLAVTEHLSEWWPPR